METSLKVMSWVEVVIGGLAMVNGFGDMDFYAFIGGLLFLVCGILALSYIKQVKEKCSGKECEKK
jgi:hypothetical protein